MDVIKWLQGQLSSAGLYSGKIDGLKGPRTDAALSAYLKMHPGKSDVEIMRALAFVAKAAPAPGETPLPITAASYPRLSGVHPDLVNVFLHFAMFNAPEDFDVRVTCGVRTVAEQKEMVRKKLSRTMKSRHIPSSNRSGKSEAIDLAVIIDGKADWTFSNYQKIATGMRKSASTLGVPIVWGGDWKGLVDGPHFELRRQEYPA